eukprot:TRINITY_DN3570_c0_g3_i1.p1 TRINITY_DN3570_c0_g3~~TRINITY_DN3570_c0_g3_i1.p1  ORF type:complete len:372 (-),score=70.94 TRINITY_DN3570_c0_g3_i1:751-1866(-)
MLEAMSSVRSFLNKHKRKILFALGFAGGGYLLYKVYNAQKERTLALEEERDAQRQADEAIQARLREHFESLQNISETTSFAAVLYNFKVRLFQELDYTGLTERLKRDKGLLTSQEKVELWERLKILSFTRTSCAIWAMTVLNLYIRAQVNILGRHIFMDQTRGYEHAEQMDEAAMLCQHRFLGSADFLSQYGIVGLISHIEKVVKSILERKELAEPFSFSELSETFQRILNGLSSSDQWLNFVIPEAELFMGFPDAAQFPNTVPDPFETERMKLKQLMAEIHGALSSNDFAIVMEQALKAVLDTMMEGLYRTFQCSGTVRIPLAKLLPPVAHASIPILEHPTENKFVTVIGNIPAVTSFFELVYTSTCGLP